MKEASWTCPRKPHNYKDSRVINKAIYLEKSGIFSTMAELSAKNCIIPHLSPHLFSFSCLLLLAAYEPLWDQQ